MGESGDANANDREIAGETGDPEVDAVLAELESIDDQAAPAAQLQALTAAHEHLLARLGAAQA